MTFEKLPLWWKIAEKWCHLGKLSQESQSTPTLLTIPCAKMRWKVSEQALRNSLGKMLKYSSKKFLWKNIKNFWFSESSNWPPETPGKCCFEGGGPTFTTGFSYCRKQAKSQGICKEKKLWRGITFLKDFSEIYQLFSPKVGIFIWHNNIFCRSRNSEQLS